MLRLGSEDGIPMLDWVEAVPRLLADPAGLEDIEREAREVIDRGVRHIIWSGMGGSVLAVQVLRALGFCGGALTIHALASTDPKALNVVVRQLAASKGIALHADADATDSARAPTALMRALLSDVVMIGVAMGRTSEEPISHLEWFADLLRQGQLPVVEHMLVMSIPDSFLQHYAASHGLPSRPLQLDGGHGTPGRMSAPATRVFLLPAALDLAARGSVPGTLRKLMRNAWTTFALDSAAARPRQHPYVRLAATLATVASDGRCGMSVVLSPELDALRWWMEQLMEESLGKGGKGVVVFSDQTIASPSGVQTSSLPLQRVQVVTGDTTIPDEPEYGVPAPSSVDSVSLGTFTLYQPLLAANAPEDRLAGIAALFLGLQLSMALYGYLWDIPFAGQPAVEDYKSRARQLRAADDPVRVAVAATHSVVAGRFTVLPPPWISTSRDPVQAALTTIAAGLTYLDLTVNGELTAQELATLEAQLCHLGNVVLGVPVKLRCAPASYHSTEQSEMDGPSGLVSLRALAQHADTCLLGRYDAAFQRAQAVGTWMAMNERERACFLLLYDGSDDELGPALCGFLDELANAVT
jgi:hypothetical protein